MDHVWFQNSPFFIEGQERRHMWLVLDGTMGDYGMIGGFFVI